MTKFLYFTLFVCPILFIVGMFSSLLLTDVELMTIGYKGWLAILGLLLFNALFMVSYSFYKKQLSKNDDLTELIKNNSSNIKSYKTLEINNDNDNDNDNNNNNDNDNDNDNDNNTFCSKT